MAFQGLNRLHCEPCSKSELDLTSMPPVQVVIEDSYVVSTGPKSSLDGSGPLEFEINSSSEHYLDLSECYLKLKLRLKNADGTALRTWGADPADGTDAPRGDQFSVVPANHILHSLFRQVEFSINDTLISSSNDTYPYRAFKSNQIKFIYSQTYIRYM